MSSKTSVSNASSYQDIGEFWDAHDATEFGEQIDAEFEVDIKSQQRYFFLDSQLSLKIKQIAIKRGISGSALLNLWIQEKINQVQTIDKT